MKMASGAPYNQSINLTAPYKMKSCIYKGQVNHKRYVPRVHAFNYSLFMMYVDLAELPALFKPFLLWSVNTPGIASFKRSDHYGNHSQSLEDSIKALVYEKTGATINGPIRLLTHFRYFGYVFNPISIFYCFKEDGETIDYVVAEVTNTPWKESHCYVLKDNQQDDTFFRSRHTKEFHVSPFMNLDMQYRWKITTPNEYLTVGIENWRQDAKLFNATISMKKIEISRSNLSKVLFNFPLMTLKVSAAIHFEALRLWLKGIRYVAHPKNQ